MECSPFAAVHHQRNQLVTPSSSFRLQRVMSRRWCHILMLFDRRRKMLPPCGRLRQTSKRRDWRLFAITLLLISCGSKSSRWHFGPVSAATTVVEVTTDEDVQRRRLALLRGGGSSLASTVTTMSSQDGHDHQHSSVASSLSSTLTTTTTTTTIPEASVIVPLHAHSGTHHVHVYVGSPPQRQTLIVDTGSRLMAFPCKSCQVCKLEHTNIIMTATLYEFNWCPRVPTTIICFILSHSSSLAIKSCGKHTSGYFDPDLSTTDITPSCGKCYLKDVSRCSQFTQNCIIHQKYTEGSSWVAQEMEDVVWLGSADPLQSLDGYYMHLAIPYAFGCQTSERGLFRKQYADGILGLAKHETSLIYALHEAKAIPRNAFSLCFTRTAGYLAIGGDLPTQRHLTPMQFTDISRDHGWYSLTVWQVLVGNTCVACDTESPILK
jgi:hypothetical protein